jgi:hypothetical protein
MLPFVEVDRHVAVRLAWKYATLLTLRSERAAGKPIPERTFFRELCAEFPGALKELDRLPQDLLERRHHQLQIALSDNHGDSKTVAVPLWAAVAASFHRSLRGGLTGAPNEPRQPRGTSRVACAAEDVARAMSLDEQLVRLLLFPWSNYGAGQLADSGTIAGAPVSSMMPATSQHIDASPSSLNRVPASTQDGSPLADSHWPVD